MSHQELAELMRVLMNNAQNNDLFCVLFFRTSKGAVHALGIEYIRTFITLLGCLKYVFASVLCTDPPIPDALFG